MTQKQDPARGTWTFVVDVPGPDGRRRQVRRRGFATKAAAADAERDLLRSVRTGRRVLAARTTFGDFLRDRWLPALDADPRLKPTTKAGYRNASRHLIRHLGAVRLDVLAGDDLERLYGELRALGRSESLCHMVHVTAHKALGAAVRWRLVGFNPADDAAAPAQAAPQPKAWTSEQVGRFLDVAADDRWAPLWRLAATTGMRRGELVGIRWSDLDLDRAALTVANNITVVDHILHDGTPKGNRARSLRLDGGTVAALRTWRRTQAGERLAMGGVWPDHDLVFTWPDGSVVHPDVVTRTYKRLVAKAGLPLLRLHALRHAWATNALRAGVDVKDVATRLGHSSTRITHDIYVAPSSDRDAAAAELVAGLYGESRQNSVTKL
jgi:integrase